LISSNRALPPLAGILIASVLLISHSAAMAQDVWISVTVTCKDWSDARSKGISVNLEHYVEGFIDGFSLASNVDFWGIAEATRLTPPIAFLRMDTYCRANPSGNTLEGAHQMMKERRRELAAASKPESKKKR
jgi:hypothetical protein